MPIEPHLMNQYPYNARCCGSNPQADGNVAIGAKGAKCRNCNGDLVKIQKIDSDHEIWFPAMKPVPDGWKLKA